MWGSWRWGGFEPLRGGRQNPEARGVRNGESEVGSRRPEEALECGGRSPGGLATPLWGGGLWEMERGFRATAVSACGPHSATAVQKRAWRLDFSVGALMGFGAGYKPALHITDFCGCVRGRRRG